MNRISVIIILTIIIVLSGCNKPTVDIRENTINTANADNGQKQPEDTHKNTIAANPSENEEFNLKNQPKKMAPVEKQGNNLSLPPAFPIDIIPITDDANITSIYDDGESYAIVYQTNKKFEEVVRIYQNCMNDAQIIMEDVQGKDHYYTINGTKDKNNVFITVTRYMQNSVIVSINTNQFDLTALDQGNAMRDIPNGPDFTPLVIIDPTVFEPLPAELSVENQSIKMVVDNMLYTIYVNESQEDFKKISNDVIFKQRVMPSDEISLYRDGDIIPAIFEMIDTDNEVGEFTVVGVVEFNGKKYSLAEHTHTIKLTVTGHRYVPNSDKIKLQVFIPHTGDGYWFAAWNSREIHFIELPKYLIQAEGLENMLEKVNH